MSGTRARFGAAALAAALAAGVAGAGEGDLDGEAILRKFDRDNRADDERALIEMLLVTRRGTRARRLEMHFKWGEHDDDRHLLRFHSPASERGTAVLTVEASGRADDQWLYLPTLRKSKRISSSSRTNRFAQTDFTFEDLRSEDFGAFAYERLGDDAVAVVPGEDPVPCFVVQAVPREPDRSGYSKRLLYVDRERFVNLKIEYFAQNGALQKTLTNRRHVRASGLWRVELAEMVDHQRGSTTRWRVTERTINGGLADGLFTTANLERGL